MTEKMVESLRGVPRTLLMTLYARVRESQQPDPMLKDDKAVEIASRIGCDFSRLRMPRHDEIAVIMRMRKFDDYVRDFLARTPDSVVVHIGCGLDTRFERVDNGRVEWFDLDLPDVIELRRKLVPTEGSRYHMPASSVFEDGWMEEVDRFKPRPFLFVAEGVFPYFEEARIKALFLKLRDHFPGSELVCDAHTPYIIWMDNLLLAFSRIEARLRWGLKHARDVEKWGDGISLLSEWFYFDDPEPRMKPYRWMRHVPLLGRSTGIFRFLLGHRERRP